MAYEIQLNDDEKFLLTNGSGNGIADIELDGTVTVTGDLFVKGNRTQLDTSTLTVEDKIITVGRGMQATTGSASAVDTGLVFERGDGAEHQAMLWKHSTQTFSFGSVIDDADSALDVISIGTYADISTGNIYLNNKGADSEVSIIHGSNVYRTTNEGSLDFGSLMNVRSEASVDPTKNVVDDYYQVTAGAIREEKYANDGESYWRVRAAPEGNAGDQIVYTQDLLFGSEGLFINGEKLLVENANGYVISINGLDGIVDFSLYDLLDVEGDHTTLADPYDRVSGKYLQYHSDGKWKPSFIETINEILDVNDAGKFDRSVLQWDSVGEVWRPSSRLMVEELWELNDVDIDSRTAPSNYQLLRYNEGDASWHASLMQNMNEIANVNATPTGTDDGKTIKWSTTTSAWELSDHSTVEYLDDLVDVDAITDLGDNSLLKYNVSTSLWQVGIIDYIDEIGNVSALHKDTLNPGADASQHNKLLRYNTNSGSWYAGIVDTIDEIGNVYIPDYNLLEDGQALIWNDVESRFEFGNAVRKLFYIGDVYEDELTMEDGRYLVWDSAGASGPGWYKSANGQIQVLNDLLDCTVLANDLAPGKVLRYNDGLEQWEPGIIEQLSEVGDVSVQYVDINNPNPGSDIEADQLLKWTGAGWTHKFVERIEEVRNVIMTNPEEGQYMRYDPNMVADANRGIVGAWYNTFIESIDEIQNVSLAGIAHGKVLEWDSTANNGNGGFVPSESVRVEYINDLLDADVPTDPANISFGALLRFNGSKWADYNPYWVSDLNSVTDVEISNPQNGNILTYQEGEWVNSQIVHTSRLTELYNDVSISSPASGEVLTYNGTEWVNSNTSLVDVLDDLDDVAITSPVDNNILRYNEATGQWANTSLFVPATLEQLDNVTVDDVNQDGQMLVWDSAENNWVNTTVPVYDTLGSLLDVTVSSPAMDDVLYYNGSYWAARNFQWIENLGDLLDVDLTDLATSDVIFWDGTNWVPENIRNMGLVLNDLQDVSITAPVEGQTLAYHTGTGAPWRLVTPVTEIDQLTDVDTGGRQLGHYLRFNGLTWVSGPLDGGDVATAIMESLAFEELGDVTFTNVADKDVVMYDDATSEWINVSPSVYASNMRLDDLSNVDTSAATNNYVLAYKQATTDYQLIDVVDHVATSLSLSTQTGTNEGDVLLWDTVNSVFAAGALGGAVQGSDADNVLTWNGTAWVSAPLPEDKFIRLLSELDDVETEALANIENNQILRWNATNQYWENVDWPSIDLGMLQDVDFTSPVANSIVQFNGTSWVNTTLPNLASNVLQIHQLANVEATAPQDGYILSYDASSGDWIAQSADTALAVSNASLSSLTDVANFTPTSTKKYFVWDDTSGLWTADEVDFGVAGIDSLADITIANVQVDDVLQWDGSEWVNSAIVIPRNLDDMLNVSVTNPADGALLEYSQSVNEWIAVPYNIVNNLADLDDVNVSGVAAGDTLIYQGGTWVPIQVPPVTIELGDLTDVDVSATPTQGDQLQWDAVAETWVRFQPVEPFIPLILDELNDVVISGPVEGHILTYTVANGWVNSDPLVANPISVSDLSDTAISSPLAGSVLVFNAGTNVWENQLLADAASEVISLANLSDVGAVNANATYPLFKWNGSEWVAGRVEDLDEIAGVNTTGKVAGDALIWDGSAWVNGTPSNVDATTLDGIDGSNYVRSDVGDTVYSLAYTQQTAITFGFSGEVIVGRTNAGDTSYVSDNVNFRKVGTGVGDDAEASLFMGQAIVNPMTTPNIATIGALWADASDSNNLKYYDGTEWIDIVGFARDVDNFVVQGGSASVSDLTIDGIATISIDAPTATTLQANFKSASTSQQAWIKSGGMAIADVDNPTYGNDYLETSTIGGYVSIYAKGDDLYQRTLNDGSRKLATITDVQNEIAVSTAAFAEVSGGTLSLGIGNTFIRLNIANNNTSTITLDGISNLDNGNMVTIMPTANSVITQWGTSTNLQITLTSVSGIYVNGVFTSGDTVTINVADYPGMNLYYYEDNGDDYVVIHAA